MEDKCNDESKTCGVCLNVRAIDLQDGKEGYIYICSKSFKRIHHDDIEKRRPEWCPKNKIKSKGGYNGSSKK
jgi:hypothetical protein